LSQVLTNAPSYNDNQLTGNVYASRTINGVKITTSPTGTDDLLTYDFPLGVTDVSYLATDETGNSCECNFQVNVTDALAPVVICPPDQITNVWNSWAEPTGSDLIDTNIHFWQTVQMGAYQNTVTTTTAAPTTTTTTTTAASLWDCNCASALGDAQVWSDKLYDNYFWDSAQGDITRITATSVNCPTLYKASDLPTTSQQAVFMVDRTPNGHTAWAFHNTMTFSKGSFGRPDTAVYQGTYCPTVDPNFWYNAAEDSFIWLNNGDWSLGKPSVEWIGSAAGSTTCTTYDQNLCSGGR
jgi:PIN domain nuclease of toxin-antitoxin system